MISNYAKHYKYLIWLPYLINLNFHLFSKFKLAFSAFLRRSVHPDNAGRLVIAPELVLYVGWYFVASFHGAAVANLHL